MCFWTSTFQPMPDGVDGLVSRLSRAKVQTRSFTKQSDPPGQSFPPGLIFGANYDCFLCAGSRARLKLKRPAIISRPPVRIKTCVVHTHLSPSTLYPSPALQSHPYPSYTHFYTLRTHPATMQFNKLFKDPSPSPAKPSTGQTQTQASSQTSVRTAASSHGAVFF